MPSSNGASAGARCRIVTDTAGERHVSDWCGNPDEAREQLSLEAALHGAAGWDISILLTGDGRVLQLVMDGPRGTRRLMWIETFDPLDDKTPHDPDAASSGRASTRRRRR